MSTSHQHQPPPALDDADRAVIARARTIAHTTDPAALRRLAGIPAPGPVTPAAVHYDEREHAAYEAGYQAGTDGQRAAMSPYVAGYGIAQSLLAELADVIARATGEAV